MSEYKDLFGNEVKKEKEKPVTYVGFVWDHSGSMGDCKSLARTNFNEQLITLKKDSDKVDYITTIIEFDGNIKEVVVNKPINEVEELKDYWVGGVTALYDSIGLCIDRISKKMESDKREDKAALIIVMTDGMENASNDYDNESIRALIKEMDSKDNWTFVFMGAGIDEKQAKDMGFGACNTVVMDKSAMFSSSSSQSQNASISSYSDLRVKGITKTDAFYNDHSMEDKGNSGE